MEEKIVLDPKTRKKLMDLAEALGLYLEGNVIKLIDSDGDQAFQQYLQDALKKDQSIRGKRLTLTKQIQEQNRNLKELNQQLLNTIRDLEKAKNQAVEALRKSDRQNEGIGQFSWMLSHNLRGPVSSLLGIISLVSRELSDSPRMLPMVQHLNDTAGKIDLKIKEISEVLETHIVKPEASEVIRLEQLITEVYEKCAEEHGGEPTEFISEIPDTTELMFPSNSLRRILASIFENALEFRREGILNQIRVRVEETEYESSIYISDNGIGIPENLHDRIFEPFKVFSDRSTGRGMGLYVAKSLLESVNGRIEVRSKVDSGTTFIITIETLH